MNGRQTPCVRSRRSDAESIADLAMTCLLAELAIFPKPGLVSCVDAGSHVDMDASTFRTSAESLRPYLRDLAAAGAHGVRMNDLRRIGLEAEAAMMVATGGINTHRGAIFGLGLLCAAAGAQGIASGMRLGATVSRLWGSAILEAPVPSQSHGGLAFHRYGAAGARAQAAFGFPAIYSAGLPSLRRARVTAPHDDNAACVACCFTLMAELEDTNLLHRAGPDGLRYARETAARFLENGGISTPGWFDRARAVHRDFVARGLSPGGTADLLAMTLFVDALEPAIGQTTYAEAAEIKVP